MSTNNGGNYSKANTWRAKSNCKLIVKDKKIHVWITTLSDSFNNCKNYKMGIGSEPLRIIIYLIVLKFYLYVEVCYIYITFNSVINLLVFNWVLDQGKCSLNLNIEAVSIYHLIWLKIYIKLPKIYINDKYNNQYHTNT